MTKDMNEWKQHAETERERDRESVYECVTNQPETVSGVTQFSHNVSSRSEAV